MREVGSDATAACGGLRELSEWLRSADSKQSETVAGHRNRKITEGFIGGRDNSHFYAHSLFLSLSFAYAQQLPHQREPLLF